MQSKKTTGKKDSKIKSKSKPAAAKKNTSKKKTIKHKPAKTAVNKNDALQYSFVPQWLIDAVTSQIYTISNQINGVAKTATNTVTQAAGKLSTVTQSLTNEAKMISDNVTGLPAQIITNIGDKAFEPFKNIETKAEAEIIKLKDEIMHRLEPAVDIVNLIIEIEKHAVELGAETATTFIDRLRWTFNIYLFLAEPFVAEFEELKKDLDDAYNEAKNNNVALGAATAIISILKRLNPAVAAGSWVVECIINRSLTMPDINLPFEPGKFHEFINGSSDGSKLEEGEREFRIEFIGAIDRFIHNEHDTPDISSTIHSIKEGISHPKRSIEALSSSDLLSGLIRTVIKTTLGYLFRLPHVQSVLVPKMSLLRSKANELKTSAVRMSETFSHSISHSLKAIAGLGLRGVWEFSTFNEALVESVASTVASTVAGILESAVQSLLSLIEIRELLDDKHPRCLKSFSKTIDGSEVFDVLWIRDSVPIELVPIIKNIIGVENKYPLIDGLLKDYVAYLEVSQIIHEPEMTPETENIQVTYAAQTDDSIEIKAVYTREDNCQPVLRAYAEGKCSVLKFNNGEYNGSIKHKKKAPKNTVVFAIARELAYGKKEVIEDKV